jgi:F-type H+-transporting ATPase subunit delta
LTRRSRLEAVRHIFAGRVSERLESLLAVLARHGRLGALGAIAQQARRLLRVRQGTLEVTVSSAVELSDQQRQEIAAALSQALSSNLLLETRVEPELVAGLSIRVGDRLLDASVRARLKQLRRQLSGGRLSSP